MGARYVTFYLVAGHSFISQCFRHSRHNPFDAYNAYIMMLIMLSVLSRLGPLVRLCLAQRKDYHAPLRLQ
jgi:hypothetical protein